MRCWSQVVISISALTLVHLEQTALAAGDCVDVTQVSPPANPGDTSDDRASIVAAIQMAVSPNGPHAVCFPAGTYYISSATSGVSFDLGNPLGTGIAATNLTLVGVGSGSVLKMDGTAGGASWTLFQLNNGAGNVAFRDLVLDGTAAAGSTTTLVQIGTGDAVGASSVSFDGVVFQNARGNAVAVRGSLSAANVSGIAVRKSTFSGNTANAINIAQGVRQVQVENSIFSNNSGEDIKTTYTGTPTLTAPIEGLIASNNLFVRASTPIAVNLGGFDTRANQDATVSGNIILGRVQISDWDRLAFSHNVVVGTFDTADPEVFVSRHGSNLIFNGNSLFRLTATPASVFFVSHASGYAPDHIVFGNNTVAQSSPANIVQFYSATEVNASENYLQFFNSSLNTYNGFVFRALNNAMSDLVTSANTIVGGAGGGSLLAGITYSPQSFAIDRMLVTSNIVSGAVYGVSFAGGTGYVPYTTVPVVNNNLFDVTSADVSGLSSAAGLPAIAEGGNVGGPVQLSGNGAPSVAAPVGSLYYRRDGAPTLYVKESGVGSAGWVAK